jgi:hypothetical protein
MNMKTEGMPTRQIIDQHMKRADVIEGSLLRTTTKLDNRESKQV